MSSKRVFVGFDADPAPDLGAAYREMAQDKQSEAEALEWIEGTLGVVESENEEERPIAWQ